MVQFYKNKKFFGVPTSSENNVIETKFLSGKTRYTLRNSSTKLVHDVSFLVTDSADEVAFWDWYRNSLLSRTETVELPNLITGKGTKEYRLTQEPQIEEGLFPKTCNLSVIEE